MNRPGTYVRTDWHRQRSREINLGRKVSDETKQKLSKTRKEMFKNGESPHLSSEEHRKKMADGFKKWTSENRARPYFSCKVCGNQFQKKHPKHLGLYCSRKCSGMARRKTELKIIVKCDYCGKMMERYASQMKNHFTGQSRKWFLCSQECVSRWRKGKFSKVNHPNYIGGKRVDEYRGRQWRTTTRSAILDRDNYTCKACGISYREKPGYLDVDHVIPFRTFSDDSVANRYDNLQLLCKRCHTKKTNNDVKTFKLRRIKSGAPFG